MAQINARNCVSSSGNKIPNQIIINYNTPKKHISFFQSYGVIVAKYTSTRTAFKTELDKRYWNYSKTTSTHLNKFLGATSAEVKENIKNGRYTLTNLNKEVRQ